jgi:hypothetical protein
MTPELRAIADRFMYETATLKHMLALFPEGAAEREVPGHAWTVRQHAGHLAESLHTYTEVLERWLAGAPPLEGFDPDAINAATAASHAETPLSELVSRFDSGIRALIGVMDRVPDEKLDEPFGPRTPLEVLHVFERHCLGHAIPLVQAVPEVRMDPLVLNWLLYATFSTDADKAWQSALYAEAREYVANLPQEEDE